MEPSLKTVAALLREAQDILIISHMNPDGDTIGSGLALCYALRKLDKRARLVCSDPIPAKYDYIADTFHQPEFAPRFVVAVDLADTALLGENLTFYQDKIHLCIDHHIGNRVLADYTYVDEHAAATAEIIYLLLQEMQIPLDSRIASCIFTALTTDTGCFRYSNTTPRTHRMAAEMMEYGADAAGINRIMFETKSAAFIALQSLALQALEMHFEGLCALVPITQAMFRQSGTTENDVESLSSLPRQIEGVQVGVMMRERKNGNIKISVRTHAPVNASDLCRSMGGGGHRYAAGCEIKGTMEEAKAQVLHFVEKALARK